MNILIVDDEVVLLQSMKIGLENSGYRVFEARNVRQALERLKKIDNGIDLVATDYMMPELSGLDLLGAIRREHPALPVIIFTAYADKSLVIEAMKKSCNSFIEKPFTPSQLIDEIERIKSHCLSPHVSSNPSQTASLLHHRIRNSLSTIISSAELILLRPKNEATLQRHAQKIIHTVVQIQHILNEVTS